MSSDLIAVLENVQSIQAQGYARNVAYNKEIEAQLGEARKNIQKAVSEFRVNTFTDISWEYIILISSIRISKQFSSLRPFNAFISKF